MAPRSSLCTKTPYAAAAATAWGSSAGESGVRNSWETYFVEPRIAGRGDRGRDSFHFRVHAYREKVFKLVNHFLGLKLPEKVWQEKDSTNANRTGFKSQSICTV